MAAVGICNPISTLFILFLNGLCMGASILMGNMFGAKEYDKLHKQISTTMISGVIFSGLIFTFMYNCFASTLCALGDSNLLLTLHHLYSKEDSYLYDSEKKWLVFDPSLLKQTIAYGWASAMQQATVQLGKLVCSLS
ncbi:MAG: MATE family efflux transporter [Anaerostipes hadrus]